MVQALEELAFVDDVPWRPSAVAGVVRIHSEPWVHVDDWTVHEALTREPESYLRHLQDRLGDLANGRREIELPAKKIFSDPEGDFRVMPCVTGAGVSAVKTVKVVGTNLVGERVPDQITVGKALRLDPRENFVTHVFDACLLSSARTAGCATLALRRLAPNARRITLVGAGRVGFYLGLYLATSVPGLELVIFDREEHRAEGLRDVLAAGGVNCLVEPWANAVASADAILIATSSREPLLGPADTDAGCIVSVGADSWDQHELSEDWIDAADLFMDTVDALEVGDLHAWLESGQLAAPPKDMFTLFRSEPVEHTRAVFVSTGSALFDNLTIEYLLSAGGL